MDQLKKRILFVHFSDLKMTGGEQMTLRLLLGILESSRFEPVLLTQRQGPLAEAAIANGVCTIILPLPARLDRYDGEILRYSGLRKLRTAADLVSYNRQLARALKREKVSGVWCSNIRALLTIGFAAKLLRVPIVWNIWLPRSFGKRTQIIYDLASTLASHIVTEYRAQPAKVFSKLTRRRKKTKISTVYTGIDPSFFDVQPLGSNQRALPSEPFELISCCRITPRKDIGTLLEAARILHRRGRNIHITIVGSPISETDIAYYSELLRKVEEDGTESVVRFTPWSNDVRTMFAGADLYVSASSSEGLPGAVREAQAAGLAVVATNAGGTSEALLDQETGFIVPCGNADALADAIERLAADPALAANFGTAARKRASALFSIGKFIDGYSEVFRMVLDGHRVPASS